MTNIHDLDGPLRFGDPKQAAVIADLNAGGKPCDNCGEIVPEEEWTQNIGYCDDCIIEEEWDIETACTRIADADNHYSDAGTIEDAEQELADVEDDLRTKREKRRKRLHIKERDNG